MSDAISRLEIISESPDDTRRIGSRFGAILDGGILIGLDGDLGSGKTCFVQGLAQGLGVSSDEVSSPTFVICHVYQGRLTLLHADAYRLKQVDEFEDLGIFESLENGAAVVVEWSQRVAAALPADRIQIQIEELSPERRRFAIQAIGEISQLMLAKY